ncbi:MAG: cupin domain-containing protein [Rhodospirillaceae bacterium]|jgi:hypothetical protein|nr:cupin domain-containing protein [Rhodospirillaceae bacterium]MBT4590262.1 cupin domain-containing protein [Rhodospirillaceae bacterium]MBT4940029.1 cupin domain-containing protein [Rhodospirillaceae bacterium]MBT7266357.1 cupin domain-containing protein [Rhodospirillaceae bacterium]
MGTRRVVAGHDESGKAVIQFDGDAPSVAKPTNTIEITNLWITDQTPASNSGDEDPANQKIGIPPPPNGSIFRIVEFGPEGAEGAEDEREHLAASGADQQAEARHPGMHKTHSIDYAIIMTGEIYLLVDEAETLVRAGDVVVQRGNNHAWANRGTEACRIAFILIDAEPVGDN